MHARGGHITKDIAILGRVLTKPPRPLSLFLLGPTSTAPLVLLSDHFGSLTDGPYPSFKILSVILETLSLIAVSPYCSSKASSKLVSSSDINDSNVLTPLQKYV